MLNIGVSQIGITPPVGVELAGYAFGPSVGVLDELQAQAMVLESGGAPAAIITADLLGFNQQVVENVRSRVESASGIPARNVAFNASHTHSGPAVVRLRHWGEPDAAYLARLEDALVGVVARAKAAMAPARVAAGVGYVDNCSVNRRGQEGTIDPAVPVFRFDDKDGNILAVIWNFGCHPVALHSFRNLITPDYVGYARHALHRLLGPDVVVMFILGANGDTNPTGFVFGKPTIQNARRVGETLACEAGRVVINLTPADAEVAVARRKLTLPLAPLPPAEKIAELRDNAAKDAERLAVEGVALPVLAGPRIIMEWAEEALAELEAGQQTSQAGELMAFRLGDAGILATQFETFTETGLGIKEALAGKTVAVAGNSNTAAGYLPTADAYATGDYTSPDGLAPKVYAVHGFAPDAEPYVRREAIELLKALFAD